MEIVDGVALKPKRIVNLKLGEDNLLYFQIQWENSWVSSSCAMKMCGSSMLNSFLKEHGFVAMESSPGKLINTDSNVDSKSKSLPEHCNANDISTTPFELGTATFNISTSNTFSGVKHHSPMAVSNQHHLNNVPIDPLTALSTLGNKFNIPLNKSIETGKTRVAPNILKASVQQSTSQSIMVTPRNNLIVPETKQNPLESNAAMKDLSGDKQIRSQSICIASKDSLNPSLATRSKPVVTSKSGISNKLFTHERNGKSVTSKQLVTPVKTIVPGSRPVATSKSGISNKLSALERNRKLLASKQPVTTVKTIVPGNRPVAPVTPSMSRQFVTRVRLNGPGSTPVALVNPNALTQPVTPVKLTAPGSNPVSPFSPKIPKKLVTPRKLTAPGSNPASPVNPKIPKKLVTPLKQGLSVKTRKPFTPIELAPAWKKVSSKNKLVSSQENAALVQSVAIATCVITPTTFAATSLKRKMCISDVNQMTLYPSTTVKTDTSSSDAALKFIANSLSRSIPCKVSTVSESLKTVTAATNTCAIVAPRSILYPTHQVSPGKSKSPTTLHWSSISSVMQDEILNKLVKHPISFSLQKHRIKTNSPVKTNVQIIPEAGNTLPIMTSASVTFSTPKQTVTSILATLRNSKQSVPSNVPRTAPVAISICSISTALTRMTNSTSVPRMSSVEMSTNTTKPTCNSTSVPRMSFVEMSTNSTKPTCSTKPDPTPGRAFLVPDVLTSCVNSLKERSCQAVDNEIGSNVVPITKIVTSGCLPTSNVAKMNVMKKLATSDDDVNINERNVIVDAPTSSTLDMAITVSVAYVDTENGIPSSTTAITSVTCISNAVVTKTVSKLYCKYCDRTFSHRRQFQYHEKTYCEQNNTNPKNNQAKRGTSIKLALTKASEADKARHLQNATNDLPVSPKYSLESKSDMDKSSKSAIHRLQFAVTSPIDNEPILPITGFDQLLENRHEFQPSPEKECIAPATESDSKNVEKLRIESKILSRSDVSKDSLLSKDTSPASSISYDLPEDTPYVEDIFDEGKNVLDSNNNMDASQSPEEKSSSLVYKRVKRDSGIDFNTIVYGKRQKRRSSLLAGYIVQGNEPDDDKNTATKKKEMAEKLAEKKISLQVKEIETSIPTQKNSRVKKDLPIVVGSKRKKPLTEKRQKKTSQDENTKSVPAKKRNNRRLKKADTSNPAQRESGHEEENKKQKHESNNLEEISNKEERADYEKSTLDGDVNIVGPQAFEVSTKNDNGLSQKRSVKSNVELSVEPAKSIDIQSNVKNCQASMESVLKKQDTAWVTSTQTSVDFVVQNISGHVLDSNDVQEKQNTSSSAEYQTSSLLANEHGFPLDTQCTLYSPVRHDDSISNSPVRCDEKESISCSPIICDETITYSTTRKGKAYKSFLTDVRGKKKKQKSDILDIVTVKKVDNAMTVISSEYSCDKNRVDRNEKRDENHSCTKNVIMESDSEISCSSKTISDSRCVLPMTGISEKDEAGFKMKQRGLSRPHTQDLCVYFTTEIELRRKADEIGINIL